MKRIFFLLPLLFAVSCRETRHFVNASDKIEAENDTRFKRLGFDLQVIGGGAPNTIRKINRIYSTDKYRFTSIDEARIFFVELLEDFLKPFNENKEVRPYLNDFPFGAKNLTFAIIFTDEKGYVAPPSIGLVGCYEGTMQYCLWNSETRKWDQIATESYIRAKSIALHQQLDKK